MSIDLTAVQNFAVNLLLDALGENPYNRTVEEYAAIKSRIPKNLKTVHHLVNRRLTELSRTDEFRHARFCRFRAGDKIVLEETYPTSISVETIRQGLIFYGWRDKAHRRRS